MYNCKQISSLGLDTWEHQDWMLFVTLNCNTGDVQRLATARLSRFDALKDKANVLTRPISFAEEETVTIRVSLIT